MTVRRLPRSGRRIGYFLALTALSATCAVLVGRGTANAYVRYQTRDGKPFAWSGSCVFLTAFPAPVSTLTREQTTEAISGGVAAWSKNDPSLASCSYLDLRLSVATEGIIEPASQYDGTNIVRFLRDVWCSHLSSGQPTCYDPAALALTTTFARTSTGEIADADIEINAVDFVWADLTSAQATAEAQDLQSAITHEVGHVIGLDHPCRAALTIGPLVDQNGNPAPDCSDASPAVMETTMFPYVALADISKRSLSDDDRQAVCDIYPSASDPMSCSPIVGTDGGLIQIDASGDRGVDGSDGSDASGFERDGSLLDAFGVADRSPIGSSNGCGCSVGRSRLPRWITSGWVGLMLLVLRSRPSASAKKIVRP